MTLLYILIVLALIQGLVSLRDGLRNMRWALAYVKSEPPPGKVIVFCPVKGAEVGLEANARSLLSQHHMNFRVIFLVDARNDPAVAVLSAVDGAEVVVGGQSERRGQKVHNLLCGIEQFGSEADIWVFADADARFPPDWLDQLIGPLGDAGVGASTGYRWYLPERNSVPSLIRSAWNATVAGFLGPHENNFAWGGSTAIRRATFLESDIGRLWDRAVSDDYALTYGIRQRGLRIAYVPTCLIPAHEGCDWRGLIEFTTRQIRITRVYAPGVWRLGVFSNTLFNLTFFWMSALILAGRWGLILPWVTIYALTIVRSEVRLRPVRHAIDDSSVDVFRWFYRLSAPLVSLLYELNFVLSLLSRRIVWKDVTYTMTSPNETRVEFR